MGAGNSGEAPAGPDPRVRSKKKKLLSARREFMEIMVDKSAAWRSKMLGDLGESIKSYALDDPDMWPGVRKKFTVLLDCVWADIEHEVTRAITARVHEEIDNDEFPGPEACCLFGWWYRIRAFVLHHYLPHNKSIWGKLNDPVYLVICVLSSIPVHGLRGAMFAIILFMLVYPGPPDEYQLINFILVFKGFQFFSGGLVSMMYGVYRYYSCYTWSKDDLLTCMNKNGPAPQGQNAIRGLFMDYAGNILLVWLAFACLSCSVSAVQEMQKQRLKDGKQETDEERYRRERIERAVAQGGESAQGGRMRGLLNWDMKCFFFSLFLLFLSAIFTCKSLEEGGSWYRLLSSPQFRTNVYWCCNVYALGSLPFAVYLIPGLYEILTHSDYTGYNKNGACVCWVIPSSHDHVEEDAKTIEEEEVTLGDKVAHLGVKIVRTIERGQEYRGADATAEYKFGDWTRGVMASYFPTKATDQDVLSAGASSSTKPAKWFSKVMPGSTAVPEYEGEGGPFHVSSVRITHVEEGHPTYYYLEVTPFCNLGESATPWMVKRRYNDFKDLARALGQQCQYPDTPFPERSRFGKLTGEALEDRRRALDLWLGSVILDSAVQDRWAVRLRGFLCPTEAGTQEYDVEAASEVSPVAALADRLRFPSDLSRDTDFSQACTSTNEIRARAAHASGTESHAQAATQPEISRRGTITVDI